MGAGTLIGASSNASSYMRCTGSALTTGATWTKKSLRIDIAGKWDSFDVLAEKDGFEICKGKLTAGYDSGGALLLAITVVNQRAAL